MNSNIDDVANEILDRCIKLLIKNQLYEPEITMAQTICFEQINNPKCIDKIKEYIAIADNKTDGAFSAVLESKKSIIH